MFAGRIRGSLEARQNYSPLHCHYTTKRKKERGRILIPSPLPTRTHSTHSYTYTYKYIYIFIIGIEERCVSIPPQPPFDLFRRTHQEREQPLKLISIVCRIRKRNKKKQKRRRMAFDRDLMSDRTCGFEFGKVSQGLNFVIILPLK